MGRIPLVVFTDLDGTLLDQATYSFEPARPALDALGAAGVPVVLCTSKTRAETERWRRSLDNAHPFIVENGGAVVIPEAYFGPGLGYDKRDGGYGIIEFGLPYAELRRALGLIREATGLPLRGFGDMSLAEIAERCGLSLEEARAAASREYDEPFIGADPRSLGAVAREAEACGLQVVSGGRFHHLVGGSDKGRAVRVLRGLFERGGTTIRAVGLGDSPNDESMLREVDVPILVRRPDGTHAESVHLPGLVIAPGQGPDGWRDAVLGQLSGPA
jgi:mannosyl-3-phosphoglycerate phosphatase